MVEPRGDAEIGIVAREIFLVRREIVLTAQPQLCLESVALQRGKEESRVCLVRIVAPRPLVDEEALRVPLFIDREVVSFRHPAGLETDHVARKTERAEFLRRVHDLELIGVVLLRERQAVRPFRHEHRAARDIGESFEYLRERIADEDHKIDVAVGQVPNDLVFFPVADVDAVPERRIAEDAVALFRHDERDRDLASLVYDALEVRLAVEHEAIFVALAEAVEFLAVGLKLDVFRVFFKIGRAVVALCLVADDLAVFGAQAAELSVHVSADALDIVADRDLALRSVGRKDDLAVLVLHEKVAREKPAVRKFAALLRGMINAVSLEKRRLKILADAESDDVFRVSRYLQLPAAEINRKRSHNDPPNNYFPIMILSYDGEFVNERLKNILSRVQRVALAAARE